MTTERFVSILITAVLAVINLAAAPVAFGTTWIVTNYGDDPGDATTLRGALHAAHDGDTIDLTGLSGAIVLSYGASPVERELPINVSVAINGPGATTLAIDGNHFSRVFHVFTGVHAVIHGLTIRNGSETGNTDLTSDGGGIRNSGTLGLIDCAVSGNSASGFGGGVYNLPNRTLTVKNCSFSANSATEGGAIANDGVYTLGDTGGELDVMDSTFANNSATRGGAIANRSIVDNPSFLQVTTSTFSNNVARPAGEGGGAGGAIYNEGTAWVSSSTFSSNQAEDGTVSAGLGGGAYNLGELLLATGAISGNSGGGVFAAGPVYIDGIYFPGYMEISNSTLYGNSAAIVGFGTVKITNSTLAANNFGISGGSITLGNTILANIYGNCSGSPSVTSLDHNLSNDTTCAAYLNAAHDFPPGTDAGLDDGLKDNGGPTKTIALKFSSAAVDAIAPSDCKTGFDQRGVSRPQGTNCDIGAFEATPDFDISPIAAIQASIGTSGSTTAIVNSHIGFNAPVTLTSASTPSGITMLFSPDPVTPASYGSASSTVIAGIGPGVTPATYRIDVSATSGTLSHSTYVDVIVGVTTMGLTQVVGADRAANCIDNGGVANAVTSLLAQAQADIDAGDAQDAEKVLNDLLALLQAQRGKHIGTMCTIGSVTFDPDAALIADVKALLGGL
ncbi:MAG TPA: choice-of-anchor Q domain-containing protein [Casimicrobiaceae bacterium]|nr:choice-of-anchor Q domain-containing protein [Casimicrobiaceae bacterium]